MPSPSHPFTSINQPHPSRYSDRLHCRKWSRRASLFALSVRGLRGSREPCCKLHSGPGGFEVFSTRSGVRPDAVSGFVQKRAADPWPFGSLLWGSISTRFSSSGSKPMHCSGFQVKESARPLREIRPTMAAPLIFLRALPRTMAG